MKSIKDYLKKYSPEQIARNKYYHDELINFFGNDIPEKYIQLYENCNLLNDEFISENLQSHDAEKLYLASRNLTNTAVIMADEINVYDIVNADTVVFDEDTVNYIEEALK